MIESIELINWKTHRHTNMRFQKGVNVLIGVMGAGKSSIMDAISFALFGTFPALLHKRTSTKDLILNRPSAEDSAEVRLVFTVGSERYTVIRKLSRKESTFARIEKDGTYLQTQAERVNEEIAGLLKIDYDTFSRAIYSEQNRLDYFLELAKGERKRQIDQMLGLDSFARAEENTTSLVNNLRSRVKEDEQTLSQLDIPHYKKELERLSLERETLVVDQKRLIELVAQETNRVKETESRLLTAKKAQEKRNLLIREAEVSKGKINTIKAEVAKIGEQKESALQLDGKAAAKRLAHEKLNAELKGAKVQETSSMRKLTEVETEIRSAEATAKELEKIKAELEASPVAKIEEGITVMQSEIDSCTKTVNLLEGKIADAKTSLAELETHMGTCPVCERELTEELRIRLVAEKKVTVSTADLELKSKKLQSLVLKEKMRATRDIRDRAVSNSKRLAEGAEILANIPKLKARVAAEKETHAKSAAGYEKLYAQMEASSIELNEISKRVELAKRLERHLAEIAQLTSLAKQKMDAAEAIKVDEKEIDLLQSLLLKASKAAGEAELKRSSDEKYIKNLDLQIDGKAKELSRMIKMEERIEKMRSIISNMNLFKSALIETESQLRGRLVSSINVLMQDLWPQVYPYGDYPSIRLNAGKDDYGLEAAVGMNGDGAYEWVDVNGIASGGEKSIACLAMRIAMSMVIVPNLRWLILDEPTHNIDENGIEKLVGVLGEALPKIVEQVFIITHDNALKNIGNARIYQLGRDKAKNEPTSYIEL